MDRRTVTLGGPATGSGDTIESSQVDERQPASPAGGDVATRAAPAPLTEPRSSSIQVADRWLPLILFGATRAALITFSYMGLKLVPALYMYESERQAFLKPYPAFDGLCRWDCGWFLRIMRDGFSDIETTKVFPLYPAVSWVVSRLTGWQPVVSLLVVANLVSLASYFVIHRLFSRLEGPAAARWGLVLFTAYPFAYYQAAAYSEPMMILGSSLALLLARRKKHLWSGVSLGLGMMARHVTIFFGPGLFVQQVIERGFRPKRLFGSVDVLGLLVPFVFLGGWSWYCSNKFGDPLAFWNSRSIGIGSQVFLSVHEIFLKLPYDPYANVYFYVFFSMIPAAGTIALFAKRRTLPLGAAALGMLAAVLAGGGIALGRYSSSIWPAFLPLGVALSRRPQWQGPAVGILVLLQGLFFWLFSHQYAVL